jgi:uncharacterized protein YhfF
MNTNLCTLHYEKKIFSIWEEKNYLKLRNQLLWIVMGLGNWRGSCSCRNADREPLPTTGQEEGLLLIHV